ncbi:MAG: response regulator transcription factor [Candidatus Aminicenantes bacterium]|nr:response regulator transcription factor [Candidatus Aminicenantes bacterium]
MIKVLHIDNDVDHHRLTAAQLGRLSGDITLVRADSREAAAEALKEGIYDCLLTDDRVPGNAGIELLKMLRRNGSSIPCIIQSEIPEEDVRTDRSRALFNDEFHIVVDFFRFDLVTQGIHRLVDSHRHFLQRDRRERDFFPGTPPEKVRALRLAMKTLTQREAEILDLIGAGKANKVIADELFISYKTVKNHVANLFAKLGIHTRAEAIHHVLSLKLVEEDQREPPREP